MSSDSIDLTRLLDLPNEDFLPAAFRVIIGREPDIAGLVHYAKRLQNGAPRALVLAELRNSAEGRSMAEEVISPDLDRLTSRYLMVRGLPLKSLRWKLLPHANAKGPSDVAFHWERWANYYASQMHTPVDKQPLSSVQTARAPQPTINPEQAHLQRKLETLTAALQKTVSLLEADGAPRHSIQPLQEAVHSLLTARLDPGGVSWEARQALLWLAHVWLD